MIFDVGRVCIKNKGKDKGKLCVILEKIDDRFVLIDGLVKRRRCNILHLDLIDKKIKVSKNSTKGEILNLFLKENLIKELPIKKEKNNESKK